MWVDRLSLLALLGTLLMIGGIMLGMPEIIVLLLGGGLFCVWGIILLMISLEERAKG